MSHFVPYYRPIDKTRFSRLEPDYPYSFGNLESAIKFVSDRIPPNNSSVEFQIRHGSKVVWQQLPTTDSRSVELPVGDNLGILNSKVDKFHVGEHPIAVVRKIIRSMRNWKLVPRPLRRGVILAILQQHNSNRVTYSQVMRGY